jgi:YegS/Rv2252/BmrU family lipid kinase
LFREARRMIEEQRIRLIAAHAVRDPRHLNQIVDQAVADGAPMVIVGGGDGSLSCSVDFVVGRDCVFALLPLGTANSFARSLEIPLDLEDAVAAIANGRRRRIDLGLINGDYFANSAAMGLAPMIADSVPHRLKKYLGRVGYLLWAVWCLIRFRPFTARISVDGESRTFTALELRIANGRFHGGIEVVDEAQGDGVDSGEIVVQVVTGHYKSRLIRNWFATIFRLASRHDTVEELRGRTIGIETRPSLKISVDGEVSGRTPAVVEVARKAIEVVVP